uniref:Uncharacterized protein n=1 Tax=Ananas comosus var. bracteatus TaxID=296719 RepID=A0A6V7PCT5_ANACO|nr:unnamed protein product [Ananas comosus var. bracteatus]
MALAGSSSHSLLLYLSLAIINTKRCERVRAGERRRARAGAAHGSKPGRERAPGAGRSQGQQVQARACEGASGCRARVAHNGQHVRAGPGAKRGSLAGGQHVRARRGRAALPLPFPPPLSGETSS